MNASVENGRFMMIPGYFLNLCSRRGVVLATALALSAGTWMARGEEKVPVPGDWLAPAASGKSLNTSALTKWWKRFDDPVMNELITGALRNSPDLQTALSRIEVSRASWGVERAGLLPSVNGGVSARASRGDSRSTGTFSSNSSGASIDAGWEVDLFGRKRLSLQAAGADIARTTEDYYAAQVSLAAEVAEAYVDLRQSEAQLAVNERSIASRNETLQLTKWLEEAGMGDALATQQTVSTLEQVKASIPSLKQSIEQTRNRLAVLCGRTPGALNPLLSKSKTLPKLPAKIAVGIPADTLRQRPDVQAAERNLEGAILRTASAKKQRLPSLNLSGSLGIDALKAGKLFSPETTVGSIVGSLTAPIFDAGRIKQNINIQTEQQKQSFLAYESTVLNALSEVENALIAMQRVNERIEILERATTAAKQAAEFASLQYEAGQIDILNVLESQRTLLSLESQRVDTLANEISTHIQLYKALGGGWSPR